MPTAVTAADRVERAKLHISPVAAATASAPQQDRAKQAARAAIDDAAHDIDAVSLAIHGKPELCYVETFAHATLADFLEARGFAVERAYKGLSTAFRATIGGGGGGGGPTIAICAEYDALPGIGHACGHNLIASSAIAAAVGAKAAFFDGSAGGAPAARGRLVILGTPAEESGGGKVELIKRGALADVDVAMMVHPAPVDLLYPAFNAIERIVFQYHGKNAHAAMAPHDGVNALDAVVSLFNNVGLARQQFKPSWRLHGIISHGGVKPNIIPDFTEAYFYARAPTMAEVQVVKAKLVACAEGAAAATGCELTITNRVNGEAEGLEEMPYEHVRTNGVMAELYRANATATRFLPRHVEEAAQGQGGASTDMGNVSHLVPSIHPCFAIPTTPGEGNHHPGFTRMAGTPAALAAARAHGAALACTAIDLFRSPDAVAAAVAEFEAQPGK